MSLSKSQLKLINSLQQKKYRTKHGLFIAEGTKVVKEFLSSNLELEHLFFVDGFGFEDIEQVTKISDIELKKVSSLKTTNNVLALFKIPREDTLINEGLILVLDEINDPGNFGTIIRLCDWFEVKQLICFSNTLLLDVPPSIPP